MSKRWATLIMVEQLIVHILAVGMVLVIASMVFFGCVTPDQMSKLTPDQVKAWNDTNEDVYICLSALGPPPNGQFTLFILPKTAKFDVTISPTCQIMGGKISQ